MTGFSVNGQSLGGKLYEMPLKPGQTLEQAYQASENDGLDQVFLEAGGKTYVLEGDGLELSQLKQGPPVLELSGQRVAAKILHFDNEINTAAEGAKHVGSVAIGALASGLGIGGGLAWRGSQALGQQSIALAQQSQVLSEAITAVGQLKPLPIQFVAGSAMPTGSMASGLLQNQLSTGLTTTFKTSHSLILNEGLKPVEAGLSQVQTALPAGQKLIAEAGQQVSYLKRGMQLAAAGVALAGTIALGGALYGSLRSQNNESLTGFKGAEIK